MALIVTPSVPNAIKCSKDVSNAITIPSANNANLNITTPTKINALNAHKPTPTVSDVTLNNTVSSVSAITTSSNQANASLAHNLTQHAKLAQLEISVLVASPVPTSSIKPLVNANSAQMVYHIAKLAPTPPIVSHAMTIITIPVKEYVFLVKLLLMAV